MAENQPNPPPSPGSEVAGLVGPSPSLDPAAEPADGMPDMTEVGPEKWEPDAWAKQTVDLEGTGATPGLGQPPPAPAPAEPKPTAPPPGFVPQQALAEARAEAQETKAKIERMNQRFEDTIRLMQGRMNPQEPSQPQQPQLPDPEQEPVKHMQQRFDRLEQAINGLIGMQQQTAGQSQAVQAIQADEMTFKASHNDYDSALNHVRAKRTRELTGVLGLSPQQAAQALAQEEMMIAGNAMRRGDSPASAIYKLAQEWGFGAGNGNGATPAAAQAASHAAAQHIQAVKTGQENAKTLGQVSGSTPNVGMSLEALADLEGDAFNKAFDKMMNGQRAGRSQLPPFLRR